MKVVFLLWASTALWNFQVTESLSERKPFNISFLINYAKYHNSVKGLRTIIIVRPNPKISKHFEQHVQKRLLIPMLVVTGDGLLKLRNVLSENCMAFVFLKHALYFADRNVTDFNLRGRHMVPIFFALWMQPNTVELMGLFKWCRTLNILNMVVTFKANDSGTDEVHTYTPFPTLRMINLTSNSYTSYFWDKTENVQGYTFTANIFQDPPTVYKLPTDTPEVVRGPSGFLFNSFVRHVNGNAIVSVGAQFQGKELLFTSSKQLTHFGINMVPFDIAIANHTATSFPIMQTRVCVVVPVMEEVPKYSYFTHTFTTPTWWLYACSFVGVFCLLAFVNWLRNSQRSVCFGAALITSCRVMVYAPMHVPNDRLYNAFIFTLAFLGLCWTSAFTASFMALLSSGIPGKQIESVQDLLDSNLQIDVNEYKRFVFFESGILPKQLMSRLRMNNIETALNYSILYPGYAHVLTRQKWQIYSHEREKVRRPYFRIASSEMCSGTMQQAWSIEHDSPFADRLEIMISKIAQSGLLNQQIRQAKLDLHVNYTLGKRDYPTPLTLEYYREVFAVLGLLLLLSGIVFCAELWLSSHYKRAPKRNSSDAVTTCIRG